MKILRDTMATYMEANQARLSLKMKLFSYSWYNGSTIHQGDGDYYVVVVVKKLDNQIRKIIPHVVNGVAVKTEMI